MRSVCVLAGASTVYAASLVLLRGRPTLETDTGIFLSVSARLLHGDRLYAEVWDNKDPLFYYLYTAALELGGWRAPFLADIVWLCIAAASTWLLLRALCVSRFVAAVGFVVYPLLLTGAWYRAGYSETPALAFTPTLAWLWASGRARAAGFVLAAAVFLRINFSLLSLAIFLAPVLAGVPLRSQTRQIIRAAVSFALTLALGISALALRGEFLPYVRTIIDNTRYSNAELVQRGESGVGGHLEVVWRLLTPDRGATLVVIALLGIGAASTVLVRFWRSARPSSGRPAPDVMLASFYVGAAVAATATIALTALWDHHLQMIAWPGVLLSAFVALKLEAVPQRPFRIAAVVGICAIIALAFGGLPRSREQHLPLSDWFEPANSLSAEALNTVRSTRMPESRVVGYAHLGSNDESGHAVFLDEQLKLVCRMFQQYRFSPNLSETLNCLQAKRPDLIFVTESFQSVPGAANRSWNRFVHSAERLLQREYSVALVIGPPNMRVEVWTRR
jgi:hypothetical protein